MLKILAACGNGMGSSMVIKMKIEKSLRELNVSDFVVDSCSVGEAKSQQSSYDVVFASKHLIHELEGRSSAKLLGLENLMDDAEIKKNLETII
ncbi:PTS sugar transporter subunit IIB [Mammaliicoccus lentus]|uniref:PTS sugar transporter subunit IIB n=1 Tax=Mammaliicoccus TaxID=2803850 RepID=UPI001071D751|nr:MULTISPECIES: PTS sugar transporter subunit IIB [Mammaliicoccus]MBF0750013.1 PTS sugar transporter subunit IIB [Mammaliicoccus lentus]MBF0793062.1 PTS sugar transporter subunit IIB [Mammaliicoccus lentus]MBW0761081.1 PTS sugar transporter subunit IIB [Mammaliicoccus lentus]MBW0770766.1 PTS sugar transporter subunit IIB [Mammaliicoccus lentus]MCR1873419.1 PTS sugar transporter subunit IIB [Mammaliicoccus lentus]